MGYTINDDDGEIAVHRAEEPCDCWACAPAHGPYDTCPACEDAPDGTHPHGYGHCAGHGRPAATAYIVPSGIGRWIVLVDTTNPDWLIERQSAGGQTLGESLVLALEAVR